jgi:REP element-mobilizing transposase RayT
VEAGVPPARPPEEASGVQELPSQPAHLRVTNATYFVTWRVDRTRPDLAPAEREEVARSIMCFDGKRYELLAYVVMNDHVHLVVTPDASFSLESLVHSWKSYTAHRLRAGNAGRVWQSEYVDRIIRNDMELRQKIEYVLANPFERWPFLTRYRWVWARGAEPD